MTDSQINNDPEFSIGSRWIAPDCKVWEKREWGWKFLGVSKSQHMTHVMELVSNDCDHPEDIFH